MTVLQASLIILLLPVAVFAIMALFHHKLPRSGDWLATSALGICLLLSCWIFHRAWIGGEELLVNAPFGWLPVTAQKVLAAGFMVDRLTAVMLVVVTLVSFLVHLFSTKYLEGDIRYGRYYCGLLLFTASMLGLVLANNLLYLFIFWELVGLSSYLLIGHWFEKKSASNAAIKAFVTTRVGDLGMFIGILVCYLQVGSLQYADVFAAVTTGDLAGSWRTLAGLGLFFGAMGKSAQFPLHVWLPDAMEGPTPVSALIHAATMVAAGVYLTGRMLPLFDEPSLLFIAYTGGFTVLFAATIALVQDDIKKVLAYSTVSQLGYMTMGLGVGGYSSGLFHLTTHAFFKACLFLGSGAVIYAMHHEQSLKKYGGLGKKMPKTAFFYLLATLALVGFPGFSGFWSKDAILADTLAFSMLHGHWFLPAAGFTTVLLTAFYMFRQYFLTFTGKPRDHHAYDHAHEVPWQMLAPLVILGTLAVVGGGFGSWFKEMNPNVSGIEQVERFKNGGYSSDLVDRSLYHRPHAAHEEHADHEVEHRAHNLAMILSTILGLSGISLGALFYFERKNGKSTFDPAAIASRVPAVHRLLVNKYYMDELYWALFVKPLLVLAKASALFDRRVIDSVVNFFGYLTRISAVLIEVFDRIVVDKLLVLGIARSTERAGDKLSYAQSGYVRRYLELTASGVLALLCVAGVITIIFLNGTS